MRHIRDDVLRQLDATRSSWSLSHTGHEHFAFKYLNPYKNMSRVLVEATGSAHALMRSPRWATSSACLSDGECLLPWSPYT